MDFLKMALESLAHNKLVQAVAILIVMDVIFGCLRAIKEKQFNSTIGINGMIRKAGILISLFCMGIMNHVIALDLIGFVPEGIKGYLPVQQVGLVEFFGIIYIVYEVLSVLKNMSLSGLPVSKIWQAVKKFLKTETGEIADFDEEEGQ